MSVLSPPTRPVVVFLAAGVFVEIVLVGWWVASAATVMFLAFQLVFLLIVGLSVLVANYRRMHRAYRSAVLRNAILADRERLTAELHDGLGHELSVIALTASRLQITASGAIQADAARIRSDVEQAVEKLRRTLEYSHDLESPGSIATMIQRLRSSGMSITESGTRRTDLRPAIEALEYEILREALTNALTHAPGQPVTVSYISTSDFAHVTIINRQSPDPGMASSPRATPTGLDQLDRRVTRAGGKFRAGTEGGRFVTAAELPRHPNEHGYRPVDRPRTPLLATARIAVVSMMVAAGVLVGFYTWSVSGGTLEADTFFRASRSACRKPPRNSSFRSSDHS